MIVLLGRADDDPLVMVAARLAERGAAVTTIDQAILGRCRVDLVADADGVHGTVRLPGAWFDVAEVTAVYARPLGLPRLPSEQQRRAELCDAALLSWLDVTDALVVNRLEPAQTNASKPLQQQLVAECGLEVPSTLVTDDPAAVEAFAAEVGPLVYKSVSGVRSIVRRLNPGDDLARVRHLPTQFQAVVPGTDVRVHVVGQAAIAVEIESDADDYRYARSGGRSAELRRTTLPDDVRRSCVEVVSRLGLPLGGVDLRRRPDGGWVCFEVNPMPAFSWYEAETGAPISDAVADLLQAA
ncbi:RimK family alpha-L-glutamate ligase [Cellulomonas sp. PhB143]|uniref:ATP-grasp domain-containing protein n=1 Tax=Cellulomonas sp. PhB143 TaxID=2485186 RepID=UPI0018F5DC6E|nr:hypothetical protein [Cellulomonas sp. PhB143]